MHLVDDLVRLRIDDADVVRIDIGKAAAPPPASSTAATDPVTISEQRDGDDQDPRGRTAEAFHTGRATAPSLP